MNKKTKSRLEYEHQYFGFSSDAFIDSYKEMLTEVICDKGLNSATKMLRNKLAPHVQDSDALDNGLKEFSDNLRCSYERGIEYALQIYEGKIKDCFKIPDHVLLPEDRVVAKADGINEEQLDKEIEDLQQELKNIAIVMEEAKLEEACADQAISALEEAAKLNAPPLPHELLSSRK